MARSTKDTSGIESSAGVTLEKARRLAERREYAEAAEEFEKANRGGAAYQAVLGRALCFYRMGRLADALGLTEEASLLDPESGEPHFVAGLAQKDAGRWDEAVEALTRAESLGYDHASVLYHRAAAHFLAGRFPQAEEDFEAATRLLPESAGVLYNLAVVRMRRSRWREAAEALSRCVDLDPAGMVHYHKFIFETGRAEASEEFHFRGHRIKNMLALLADTSRRSTEVKSTDEAALEKLAAVANRLEKVFEEMSELLSWVKREPLELDVWDIHDVIESAVMSSAGAMGSVRIERHFGAGIPGVVCDAQALAEALLNIMLNASETMLDGGVLHIRTRLTDTGDVRIDLEDTGGGVKTDPPEKVFQFAFTTKPNGSGLGLCQAVRTVDEHGGSIEVENTPSGANFIITIPLSARIGETMRDIGLKPDLSEAISGIASGDSARLGS